MPFLDLSQILQPTTKRKKSKPSKEQLALFAKLQNIVDEAIASGQILKADCISTIVNVAEALERDITADKLMEHLAQEQQQEAEKNPLLVN